MQSGPEAKRFLIVNPDIGGGKTVFTQIISEELKDQGAEVEVFYFSRGNPITRLARFGLNEWYKRSAKPGYLERKFHSDEVRAGNGRASKLLNHQALRKAAREKREIVSVSAIAARGAPYRSSVMGDVHPEISAADANTTAYVTLPEAEEALIKDDKIKDVKVTGFLVPPILREQDKKRGNERLDKFEKYVDGEPTVDNPLRLTFMTTGQYQHLDYLKTHVLKDPIIQEWIQQGKVKLTVYMWKSKLKAYEVYKHAKNLKLDAELTSEYDPESEAGVQVFSHHNPIKATETSFQIVNDTDIVLSVMAERVGWTRYVPTIALDPGEVNNNMIENTQWARSPGLIGPQSEEENIGQTIREQLSDPYSRLRNYYSIGDAVRFYYTEVVGDKKFDVFNGANNIAAHLVSKTG